MKFCNTYKGVQEYHGKDLRYYARNLALDGLSFYQKLFGNTDIIQKPRIQFLYFHHIFSDEVAPFEKLVSRLAKKYEFISHTEAVKKLTTGSIDKPYISWSSDDGFKNNLDAARVLSDYGASCCFFINPMSIGLDDYVSNKKFCNGRLDMPPIEFMTWDDVQDILMKGHEVGSHTMKHDYVSRLSTEEFQEDLIRSKAAIEEKCGEVKHFAYPYGKFQYFTKEAFDLVFRNGYESCSTAVRGCHHNYGEELDKEKLFIRRDQVVAAWPISHMEYFLFASSKNLKMDNNFVPYQLN